VQCPYHGLRFDGTGMCVHNPHGDKRIPQAARVRNYPLVERHRLLWIWMGDPQAADASQIPDFSFMERPDLFTYSPRQVSHMPVSYELILDNLLDLTHAAYIHPHSLGSEAVARQQTTVTQTGNTVLSQNLAPDGLPAPIFPAVGACPADERVDYWADVRWDAPASIHLDVGVMPTGRPRGEGVRISSAQLLAPETETSTHYFHCMYRDFKRDVPGLSEAIGQGTKDAFTNEDAPMITAVQKRMAGRDLWAMKPVLLTTDAGAVRVRRILTKLLEAEQSTTS
jgi:phenylpropionate dioxygenase-like ring-hydroxylating dioxygenase large terminal subunit